MINVLLIDDDEDEYLIFLDAIRGFPQPVRCIYAQDSDQTFRILQNFRPNIIFVDMNMPKMNGITYIKNIKGMYKQNTPLIVLYSTYIDDKLAREAMAAGAVDCLQKTNSIDSLTDKLHPYLDVFFDAY